MKIQLIILLGVKNKIFKINYSINDIFASSNYQIIEKYSKIK